MSDQPEDVQGESTDVAEVPESVETTAPEAPSSGGNPSWDALKAEVPELTFKQIEPHLREFDKAANGRITKLNSDLAPWKQAIEQGLTPERALAANQLLQRIDADPQSVIESLTKFAQETGRMPNKQELAEQVEADAEGDEFDTSAPVDPRFAQLEAQQQQILGFMQQQANEKTAKRAEKELDKEIDSLKAAHPELSKEDVGDILRNAAATAMTTQKTVSLEEAATSFFAMKNRILSTPRPGDSAPLLAPTSGGIPASQNQKTLGQQTNQETQDLMAGLIETLREK